MAPLNPFDAPYHPAVPPVHATVYPCPPPLYQQNICCYFTPYNCYMLKGLPPAELPPAPAGEVVGPRYTGRGGNRRPRWSRGFDSNRARQQRARRSGPPGRGAIEEGFEFSDEEVGKTTLTIKNLPNKMR